MTQVISPREESIVKNNMPWGIKHCMEKIRIALADDHQLFRNGLKILLGGYPEFEVVAEASNGTELLKVLENCPTDIVLMDINMPEMDGVEATSRISRQIGGTFVIALSMYGEEEYYYRMVEAGAKGFILKDSDISDVHDAIIAVHRGGNTSRRNCYIMSSGVSRTGNRRRRVQTCRDARRRYFSRSAKDSPTTRLPRNCSSASGR